MPWTPVDFGKYRELTLPQIVLIDPDWFFWAFENGLFKTPALKAEAAAISYKARHIAIPDDAESQVEYLLHRSVGKLGYVQVVPKAQPLHQGSSPAHRSEHFDLSMPRRIAPYDKTGGKIMIKAIKAYIFGDSNIRLTRERCEAFFSDDNNFVLDTH